MNKGLPTRYGTMKRPLEPCDNRAEPDSDVSEHYAALTDLIVNHPAGLRVFHYGLYGPGTAGVRDALLRANSMLTQGCELVPGQRILDAGCGLGGMAVGLARAHGVQVVGLTNCAPHVEAAAEYAGQQGVGHLVEFHHGDFMDMPYPDAHFDAVLNHESVCFAPDKLAYLRGVHRVLKPGGRWQVLDGFLSGAALSEEQEEIHAAVYRGWHIPPLVDWRELRGMLEEAGFEQIEVQDLAAEVAPFSVQLRNQFVFLGSLVIPPSRADAYGDFRNAVFHYDEGLREGIFTYCFMSGKKPA